MTCAARHLTSVSTTSQVQVPAFEMANDRKGVVALIGANDKKCVALHRRALKGANDKKRMLAGVRWAPLAA